MTDPHVVMMSVVVIRALGLALTVMIRFGIGLPGLAAGASLPIGMTFDVRDGWRTAVMSDPLLPVSIDYLRRDLAGQHASRLHGLVRRLFDSHIGDLTEDRLKAIERIADGYRITHADGSRLD